MAEVRSITVFKCVATPGVKWCHVLQRADFEAKTNPNLVPRVARWCNVRAHFVHILDLLSDGSTMREFVAPLCVKSHHYVRSISTVVKDGYLIVLIQHFQIIYARRVATSGSPIQRLLFIPSS